MDLEALYSIRPAPLRISQIRSPCCASGPGRGGVCPSHRVRLVQRFLSNLSLARVQKFETQAGVPVGLIWGYLRPRPESEWDSAPKVTIALLPDPVEF